jgi:hypothetical protein
MTPQPPANPRSRPNWCGTYVLLRDGAPIATISLIRVWTEGIPKHIATLEDGRRVTHTDAGFAMNEALKLIVPGEAVWPHYLGCNERGLRLRAEGRAPWEAQPADESATSRRPAALPCHEHGSAAHGVSANQERGLALSDRGRNRMAHFATGGLR